MYLISLKLHSASQKIKPWKDTNQNKHIKQAEVKGMSLNVA